MSIVDGFGNPISNDGLDSGLRDKLTKSLSSKVKMNPYYKESKGSSKGPDFSGFEDFQKTIEELKKEVDKAKKAYAGFSSPKQSVKKPGRSISDAVGFNKKTQNFLNPMIKQAKMQRQEYKITEKEFDLNRSVLGIQKKALAEAKAHYGRFVFGSPQVVQLDDKTIEYLASSIAYKQNNPRDAGFGGGRGGGDHGAGGGGGFLGAGSFGFGFGGGIGKFASGVRNILAGISLNSIFEGAIVDEYEYMKNIREIAYQTEGITVQMGSLQKQWEDLGKTVKYTGQNRSVMQKAFLNNLRKGINSMEESQRITEIGLSTATQIGANAESTADLFHDWHMTMGLNVSEMESLHSTTRRVAKESGVTGDNLLQVLKNSEQLITRLRNSANLTSQAQGNVISMVAAAQKYGMTEQTNKLLSALSSNVAFLQEADNATKNLLLRAASFAEKDIPGITNQVMSGSALQSEKSMRALVNGMQDEMSRLGLGDFINRDLSEMDDQTRARLNFAVKQMYGMELGELQRTMKGMEEASRPFYEKLDKMRSDRDAVFRTTEERMRFDKQERDLFVGKSSEILSAYGRAFESNADDFGAAMDSRGLQRMLSDNEESLNAMLGSGVDVSDPAAVMQHTAETMMRNMAAEAKSAGMGLEIDQKGVMDAISSNDPSRIQAAIDTLNKEQHRIATEEAMRTDPIKGVQFRIEKINDGIRNASQGILHGVLGILGELGIIIGILGAMAAANLASKLGIGIPGAAKAALGAKVIAGNPSSRVLAGLAARGSAPGAGVGARFLGGAAQARQAGGGALARIGGGLGRVVGPSLTRLGVVFSKISGPLTVVTAGIAGLTAALKTGEHATHIFNKTADELTLTQHMAAESAGFYTGILNFLTFGIFQKALGPTGWLTQNLAHLFAAFPPLSWGAQILITSFKVLWGIIKGLGLFVSEVFSGIWEGVKIAMQPLVELWSAVEEIWKEFAGAMNIFSTKSKDMPNIIELIAGGFQAVGKVVGWLAKAFGFVSSVMMRGFIYPLIAGVKLLSKIIIPIFQVGMSLIMPVFKYLGGIFKILQGIFTLDGDMLSNGVTQALEGLGDMLWNIVTAPFTLLEGWLKGIFWDFPTWLYNKFVEGLSAVKDYILSWVPEGVKNSGSNLSAGWQGAAEASKADWGVSRGAGVAARGWGEMLGGTDWSLSGQTLGRVKGLGDAMWGTGESTAGLGAALVGRGWLWHEGGQIPGNGEQLGILQGGEVVIPNNVLEQGLQGILPFLNGLGVNSGEWGWPGIAGGVLNRAGGIANGLMSLAKPALDLTKMGMDTLGVTDMGNAMWNMAGKGLDTLGVSDNIANTMGMLWPSQASASVSSSPSTPASFKDAYRQDQAGSAPATAEVGGAALDELVAKADQLMLLAPMLETLNRLVDVLGDDADIYTDGDQETPNTKGVRRPPSPPKYHSLPNRLANFHGKQAKNVGLH